jgi:hypothetical protein
MWTLLYRSILTSSQNYEEILTATKWTRLLNREHRWRSDHGSIFDLLPAGPKVRAAKQVTR